MAVQCEICKKKPTSGHNVSHSNRHTKRRWLPNLQTIKLPIEGVEKRVKLCTRCLRTYIKKGKVNVKAA